MRIATARQVAIRIFFVSKAGFLSGRLFFHSLLSDFLRLLLKKQSAEALQQEQLPDGMKVYILLRTDNFS